MTSQLWLIHEQKQSKAANRMESTQTKHDSSRNNLETSQLVPNLISRTQNQYLYLESRDRQKKKYYLQTHEPRPKTS